MQSKRDERELLVVGAMRPFRRVLGPEVDEQKRPGVGDGGYQLRHEAIAGRINPMQIVYKDDEGLTSRVQLNQSPHELVHAPLLHLRVHLRERILRVGDAEEVEQERQHLAELGIQQDQTTGDLLPRGLGRVLGVNTEVVSQELQDGKQWNRDAM